MGSRLDVHPQAVLQEFRHPISGNFLGTVNIAILYSKATRGNFDVVISVL